MHPYNLTGHVHRGGAGTPPGEILLPIVRIVQNFQAIFVGVNEAEIPKIGQFQYFVRTLWGFYVLARPIQASFSTKSEKLQ